jgi:hypothetical protein
LAAALFGHVLKSAVGAVEEELLSALPQGGRELVLLFVLKPLQDSGAHGSGGLEAG